MKSVVNYPNRGHWGSSSWRGNTSGHIIKEIIEHFQVKHFVDICEGSGTSRDVCREMNIKYTGLDLKNGFNFLEDSISKRVGELADVVFSHPPYHDMIKYSGEQWGHIADKADLSHCQSADEFLYKAQLMLMNQREATSKNGHYMTLIGDMRKNGSYHSFQSDFINMMPKNELQSVVIKLQNNQQSNFKTYSGSFIPILHEYLLIWKKMESSIFQVALDLGKKCNNIIASTWKNAIRIAFMNLGKSIATLGEIYKEVEKVAKHLIDKNPHWKEKIRQKLQLYYTSVERGVWAV